MAASGAVWSGERTTLSPFESFSYCTGIPSPACGDFSPSAAAGFGAGALAQATAQRSGSHRDALIGFDLPPAGQITDVLLPAPTRGRAVYFNYVPVVAGGAPRSKRRRTKMGTMSAMAITTATTTQIHLMSWARALEAPK